MDLAVYVQASWLVTSDKDLLTLMTDHSVEGKQFRQLTRNQLRVVTPADFLGQIPPAALPAG